MQEAAAVERAEIRIGGDEAVTAPRADRDPDAAAVDGNDIGSGIGVGHVHGPDGCPAGNQFVHSGPFGLAGRGIGWLGRPTADERTHTRQRWHS